jgi:hypothetical protein
MEAMENPEAYRGKPYEACAGDEEGWEIPMKPFEYLRIDLAAG